MKSYILSIFIALLFLYTQIGFTQILTITEDRNGKERVVNPKKVQIVDINSNLQIIISKDSLNSLIERDYPQYTAQIDLGNKIFELNNALENKIELLNYLKQKLLSPEDKQDFYNKLSGFYKYVLDKPYLRSETNNLFEEYMETFPDPSNQPVKKEIFILSNLDTKLVGLTKELDSLEDHKFRIGLRAFRRDKSGGDRIHIKNFDTYADREFYEVERWVYQISESQKTLLDSLKAQSERYNKEAANFLKTFKNTALANLPELECLSTQIENIEGLVNNPDHSESLQAAIKTDLANFKSSIAGLNDVIAILKSDIASWSLENSFNLINNSEMIFDAFKQIDINIENFTETINNLQNISDELINLKDDSKRCIDSLKEGLNGMINILGILFNQQKNYIASKELTEEILRFTINDLPAKGFINLKTSGPRKNGHDIEIELLLITPGEIKGTPDKHVALEQRIIGMQLVGLRSETVVGIIMADSFNENNFTPAEDKRFLYSPSIALILKIGSDSSPLYNDLLDFGVGINVSSPDFNTDGTPEFGAGLILTGFKDILSLGINYNVTLDTPYWFFGINLPFNIPGLPINSVKADLD